ncbi:hypothetical protein CAPTEDRAFT_223952 [Capitella teleta]|uniref:Uncharacterized protein n=1 Tax=Capitella teleta TaxID=283909 RepID=R7UVF0_CAPTE|nr:hypothetical protein CAPTEDRAFT_223952 [Capitella teleta]|eukprot:ELU10269.1 hypothetical protein CAPTEDRAFT_223952 [Capitella teleta]
MKFLLALVALSFVAALVSGEELTNLLHKLSSEHRDTEDELAAKTAAKNKKDADKALSNLMDRLDDAYAEILDFQFNKLSKRKFRRIGKMMADVLAKGGDTEKLGSLKFRLLAGISNDIFSQFADFLNQLLMAAEKEKLETNSQATEPCLMAELEAQRNETKLLSRSKHIKHRQRTVCFYLAKNLAGDVFLDGRKECGRLQGVSNKGSQIGEFIDLLHGLPEKDLSIKQATKTIFYSLHKVYAEAPVAVYTGTPGWHRAIQPCKSFLTEYAAHLNSTVEMPEGLRNETLDVYTSVLTKASEPMAWLKQSIVQRNQILQTTDDDRESTMEYFFDFFYDLIQIAKNNISP